MNLSTTRMHVSHAQEDLEHDGMLNPAPPAWPGIARGPFPAWWHNRFAGADPLQLCPIYDRAAQANNLPMVVRGQEIPPTHHPLTDVEREWRHLGGHKWTYVAFRQEHYFPMETFNGVSVYDIVWPVAMPPRFQMVVKDTDRRLTAPSKVIPGTSYDIKVLPPGREWMVLPIDQALPANYTSPSGVTPAVSITYGIAFIHDPA